MSFLTVSFPGSVRKLYTKKRQLKGSLREKITGELIDGAKSNSAWRIAEANRLMQVSDNISPILFDSDVLRKAKQQESEKRLEISGTDPIENLYMAKYTTLQNTIHVISKDPFFCIYWTPEQQAMYAAAEIYDRDSLFIIDATGSIAKKIKLPDGRQSRHLFLYQCVSVSSTGSFPVFQCISAAQDAAAITYFLFHVAKNNPSPRTVVCDFGRALLIAVARAFCGTDLTYYLQSCYSIVVSNTRESLPKSFIRLDVSHLMAMVARWPSLKGKLCKVRQFYLRSVGRIYQMDSFDQVQMRVDKFLLRHIDYINGTLRLVSSNPSDKIQHKVFDNGEKRSKRNKTIDTEDDNFTLNSSLIEGTDDCEADANNSTNDNDCAFSVKNNIRDFSYIDSGNEEDVERIKSDVDKGVNDAEAFVNNDGVEINRDDSKNDMAMRAGNDNYLEIKNRKQNSTIKEIPKNKSSKKLLKINPLNEYENWKGKANSPKELGTKAVAKRGKPNYLDPCPDWDILSNLKSIGVPLILNGNQCNAVIVGKTRIVVIQMCPFDSLLQIFANALALFPYYKDQALDSQNSFLNLAQSIVTSGKINANHYSQRASILREIPILDHRVKTRHVETLNAKSNVGHLYEYLFAKLPSYIVNTNCHECHHIAETTYPYLNVNVNILLRNGFSEMQNAIGVAELTNSAFCTECKTTTKNKTITNVYGPQVMIDTSVFTDQYYLTSMDFEVKEYVLDDVAKTVSIGGQRYS